MAVGENLELFGDDLILSRDGIQDGKNTTAFNRRSTTTNQRTKEQIQAENTKMMFANGMHAVLNEAVRKLG